MAYPCSPPIGCNCADHRAATAFTFADAEKLLDYLNGLG